ncbi:MAG: glutamate racemase [Candidatus Thiodiazotropha sp.]|jgi:glutamate racemase
MPSSLPVGIFDSGIGGLSVLRHIRDLMPSEDLIYVSDRAHLPYGNKESQYILERSERIAGFLIQQNVKAIVIACNTATAVAVAYLRNKFSLPIVGMEPGIKPATIFSHNGIIGVLATEGTLVSGKFQNLVEQHSNGADIFYCPCHGWVEAIEHNGATHDSTVELVKKSLIPVLEKNVDTLVLGCTHYPFLKDTIEKVAGPRVTIIDTGQAVARQLQRRLSESNIISSNPNAGRVSYWCSGSPEITQALITKIQGHPCIVDRLPLASY